MSPWVAMQHRSVIDPAGACLPWAAAGIVGIHTMRAMNRAELSTAWAFGAADLRVHTILAIDGDASAGGRVSLAGFQNRPVDAEALGPGHGLRSSP